MSQGDDAISTSTDLTELDAWLDACQAELERRRDRERIRCAAMERLDRVRSLQGMAQATGSFDLETALGNAEQHLEEYLQVLDSGESLLLTAAPAVLQRHVPLELPATGPGSAPEPDPVALTIEPAAPLPAAADEDSRAFTPDADLAADLDLALVNEAEDSDPTGVVSTQTTALVERLNAELASLCARLADSTLTSPIGGDGDAEIRRWCDYRTVICCAARAAAEAAEARVGSHVRSLVCDFRNKLAYGSDEADQFPFADRYWEDGDRPSAAFWATAAEAYSYLAPAREAMEWYRQNDEVITDEVAANLLEAIGAGQQVVYRALFDLQGSDRYQRQVFEWLKETTGATGVFIRSINPNTPNKDVLKTAATLEGSLNRAKQQTATASKKRAERRIVSDVAAMIAEAGFGTAPRVKADGDRLRRALDEWMATGLTASHKGLRDALMKLKDSFLSEVPIPAAIRRAVKSEEDRLAKQAAQVRAPDDEHDAASSKMLTPIELEELRTWLDGGQVLILGGTPRPKVVDQLKSALGEDAIDWPEASKNSTASQFEKDIKRAFVLIVITKFAGHDFSTKGKEWVGKGKGVFMSSGTYGAPSLLKLLYNRAHAIVPTVTFPPK